MPDGQTDAVSAFFAELVQQTEATNGRLEAAEKAIDELRRKIEENSKIADAAGAALVRLARVEEDASALQKAGAEARSRWLEKLWSSQPFQLLLMGLTIALLNVLGQAYLAQQLQPSVVLPGVEDHAESTIGPGP